LVSELVRNHIKPDARLRRRTSRRDEDACDGFYESSDDQHSFIAGYTSGGAPYGVTWEETERMQLPMDFDRWVNDNNPDERLQYRKGWWDYIELIRRLMSKFEAQEAQVVAAYVMGTPPPQEELLMPVVKFAVGPTEYVFKYDFGVFPECWTVSIKNAASTVRPILGLFDDKQDLRGDVIAGFENEWIHGPYCSDPTHFTCEIQDEWDLAALVRLSRSGGDK
jgi:hypothetical protein